MKKVQKETDARKTNTAEEEKKKYAEKKRLYQELDTIYKKLYESMANVWLSTSSREYAAFAAQTDPHSNGKLRINRVLMNLNEFYETFDIKENDGMYIPPEDRILVW